MKDHRYGWDAVEAEVNGAAQAFRELGIGEGGVVVLLNANISGPASTVISLAAFGSESAITAARILLMGQRGGASLRS